MGETKAKDILSEINTATLENSEVGKNIGINEAKKLVEKILEYQKNNKSPFLDEFLKNLVSDYTNLESKTEEEKNSIFSNTSKKLENIKIELNKKVEEEDKKADIKAEKTWKTNILKGVGFENIENEKIRTNLLEYLKINTFGDDVIKMLEGIRDNYPEIYDDEAFCEKLLKINPYISEYIENRNIINNLIGKVKNKGRFLVLTQNTEKLKTIIDIASSSEKKFKSLIDNTDLFVKNVDKDIQKYILNSAIKNDKIRLAISSYMYKFDKSVITEQFKKLMYSNVEKEISKYLNSHDIKSEDEGLDNYIISSGLKTKNELIIDDLLNKNDKVSIKHIIEISKIINSKGGYIDEKINNKYLNPIKKHFLEGLKLNKVSLNENNSNIIKSLDSSKGIGSIDYQIVELIQSNLIDNIAKGQFGTNSKNIELLGISLEKGFPINDNKIKELFENQEKIIMNLPLEHKNEKEIQNFYSLIGDIKEFIVKSKSGINIELL
ncbi:MAG: hypothetical protein PHR68_01765, partial [Candidatus Gracilibacteria bacterium]|nr:hypothetical protein [Candidatus Gracilibacteria bacterium]